VALRVPKAELPAGLSDSMIKRFGGLPAPVEVTWQNSKVAAASLEFGGRVSEWDAAEESLKSFAHMAVAAQVGCSWCLDIGYFQAQNQNLDVAKASQLPRWRESDVFTALERDVLEYAEAVTNTPPTVTDELSARLLDDRSIANWTGHKVEVVGRFILEPDIGVSLNPGEGPITTAICW
jgi:alkylhydroperoxidase family enzyme